MRYVVDVSFYGVAAILLAAVLLMIFIDPITVLMFGHTFPDALPILALLGAHQALVHVTMVTVAGLRALESMRMAFLAQVSAAAFSVALVWYPTHAWGVLGALATMLAARTLLTGQLSLLLRRKAAEVPAPRTSG